MNACMKSKEPKELGGGKRGFCTAREDGPLTCDDDDDDLPAEAAAAMAFCIVCMADMVAIGSNRGPAGKGRHEGVEAGQRVESRGSWRGSGCALERRGVDARDGIGEAIGSHSGKVKAGHTGEQIVG